MRIRLLPALVLVCCVAVITACVGEADGASAREAGGQETASAAESAPQSAGQAAPDQAAPDQAAPDQAAPDETAGDSQTSDQQSGNPTDSPVAGVAENGTSTENHSMTETPEQPSRPAAEPEVATFGAGCFWCIEAVLEQADGVLDVQSGYMGGDVVNPTYEAVCTGRTGHAEVVQVRFDPAVLPYEALLSWFWKTHDPTQLNRQGADVGTQYRSAIFYHSAEHQQLAERSRAAEDASGRHLLPIVTEITAASTFYPAEEYHQDFYRRNRSNGYCRAVIVPKLDKLGLKK